MIRYLGAITLVLGLLGAAYAADTKPATTPSTTSKPALPACCGDKCKSMGPTCCKTDAATGKTTCYMGGSCCVKP